MIKPNLFHYATSELSQDAFLCWLLKWADPAYIEENRPLHNLGKSFIEAIFVKHRQPTIGIKSVEIRQQFYAMDFLGKDFIQNCKSRGLTGNGIM